MTMAMGNKTQNVDAWQRCGQSAREWKKLTFGYEYRLSGLFLAHSICCTLTEESVTSEETG